ncbi:hypothetical protein O181_007654 [Austropuccinia psidii MF-1]|uniref:Uncharacterized protein n=1 Tax=Austropuccinia psidii MF-1 TaxID=1389203 RepID=A0A9Q3BLA3_9BASI|nr:hypothetical protein [Austropuccinia psidii MF-1]
MKPQIKGHVLDTSYHKENIKPDSSLENKETSPSQYQDGDRLSYSEKGELKQLPEVSSWIKISGAGGYNHTELVDDIDGLFIDVPSISCYLITVILNTKFKGHASIWYTEMNNPHGGRVR